MKDSNWNEKEKRSTGIGVLRLSAKHKEYSADKLSFTILTTFWLGRSDNVRCYNYIKPITKLLLVKSIFLK